MPGSADAQLMLAREDIDTHLDGDLAAIVQETFASEERVHANGWDAIPPTALQYLRDDSAPSSVAVVPTGLARLGDAPEALRFLVDVVTSGDRDAMPLRNKLIRANTQGYLGCAVAYEAYAYAGSRQERQERYGDRSLADIPEAVEIRAIRGITVQQRRFQVVRTRESDQAVVMIGLPRGEDRTHPSTALNIELDRLNDALRDAYASVA